ncbi:MAG: DedA family protein [Acidimicrobiales bacterium]
MHPALIDLALLNFTNFVATSGYVAIFVLSVAQSCCVPTSSELTLGFAGVLAAEGKLSLPGAIIAGVAGELVGAFIAWAIGRAGGRAFVERYGKYVLVSQRDLDRAEGWYDRHGTWGVFASRCVPFIRNFVALPAGIAEVPVVRFGLLTLAGSAVWDSAMALIGYGVGSNYNKIMHGVNDAGYAIAVVAVLAIAFVIYHRYKSYKAATSAAYASSRPLARATIPAAPTSPLSGPMGTSAPEGPATPAYGTSAVRFVNEKPRSE